MTFRDQLRYSFDHLRKTRLRTFLTTFGVVIGIGAMASMVSVGAGMQRNVMKAFNEENLLTSITVRPASLRQAPAAEERLDPDSPEGRRVMELETVEAGSDTFPPLDDEAVNRIRDLRGVRVAYPVATVPGLLRIGETRRFVTLEGMPADVLGDDLERDRVDLLAGRMYRIGETDGIILSRRAAEDLLPEGAGLDTLIGREVSFMVVQMSGEEGTGADQFELPDDLELPPMLRSIPLAGLLRGLPGGGLQSVQLDLRVVGIVGGIGTFGDFLGTSVYAPLEVVMPFYGSAFRSLEAMMTGQVRGEAYRDVQVIAEDVVVVPSVQERIEELGFRTSSILDDLSEMRVAFVIANSFLAILGGISLFVASMMIINTLVMAVLERTREIGLLKALGAGKGDVLRLFLTEATVIGLLGGIGGLALGWIVARIANAFANYQLVRAGDIQIDIVAFPLWLILGGMLIAIAVSLLAGFYPARRAARVDPVVALRHF
jgi:putative ABC transport system permease protein